MVSAKLAFGQRRHNLSRLWLGGMGCLCSAISNQARLIANIEEAGGTYETRNGPKWLQNIIGSDYCRDITLVNLAEIDPPDKLLAQIEQATKLEVLILGGPNITDQTLRTLPIKKGAFQSLVLDSTSVTRGTMNELREQYSGIDVFRSDRRWNLGRQKEFLLSPIETQVCNPPPPELKKRIGEPYFEEIIALALPQPPTAARDPALRNSLVSMHSLRELTLGEFDEFPTGQGSWDFEIELDSSRHRR